MTTTRPTVLVIGGIGQGDQARVLCGKFLDQAGRRGVRVHMTDIPAYVDAAPRELIDRFAAVDVLDFFDRDACVAWAREQVADGARFDLVVTARDDAQPATAAVAEVLGLPYNSARSIEITRNKDLCRAVLAEHGFRQPLMRLCADAGEAREFMAAAPGPWIVKPRDATASRGVRLATDPADLDEAMGGLAASDRPFIVEQYVSGPEFSAEGLFLRDEPVVVALTAKRTTPAPAFIELGHSIPAPFPEAESAAIREQVARAVQAVGLTFGLFHVEFWVTTAGVVLGELHCRPGGDHISTLVELAHPKYELFGSLFDALADDRFVPDLTQDGGSAVAFLTADPGEVVAVDGWDGVAASEGVVHAHLAVDVGGRVEQLRTSMDRVGAVITAAATAEAAAELAAAVISTVRIRTA